MRLLTLLPACLPATRARLVQGFTGGKGKGVRTHVKVPQALAAQAAVESTPTDAGGQPPKRKRVTVCGGDVEKSTQHAECLATAVYLARERAREAESTGKNTKGSRFRRPRKRPGMASGSSSLAATIIKGAPCHAPCACPLRGRGRRARGAARRGAGRC